MRKSKKQLMKSGIAGLLIASMAVGGGTLAYLTDAETTDNTFTVGKVKIALAEPNYPGNDSDQVKDLVPNEIVKKDPQVKNVGINDAIIYLKVEVPKADVTLVEDGGARGEKKTQEIFTLKNLKTGDDGTWIEVRKDDSAADKCVYVFAYKTKLAKDATTTPLFDEVQLKNVLEGEIDATTQNIKITAYAIQADNILDVDTTTLDQTTLGKVYDIYVNQSGDKDKQSGSDSDDSKDDSKVLGTITYDLDGGTLTGEKTEYTATDYGYTPPEPTKEGFAFAEWSPASIPADSTGNVTFTAKWKAVDVATTLLDGSTLNVRMKTLAGDTSPTCDAQNTSITAIQYSSVAPTAAVMANPNSLVSTEDSGHPVYMWFEDGTIKWWSEAKTVNAGTSLQNLCRYMLNLTDISGLANFNTENVTSTSGMFSSNYRYLMTLTDITPLANWDTSNLTDASKMFYCCKLLSDITPVANWDTSNIKNMEYLFSNCSSLSDITPLEKWNTENVTNMGSLFGGASGIEMSLSDITPLTNWNITSVTDISYIFSTCTSLADITPLANWNIESVKAMEHAFRETAITDLVPLANWNVKNVTYMLEMFCDCKSLADASAINDWDISKQTSIDGMFSGCSVHASFTKRPGYWGYLDQYKDAA